MDVSEARRGCGQLPESWLLGESAWTPEARGTGGANFRGKKKAGFRFQFYKREGIRAGDGKEEGGEKGTASKKEEGGNVSSHRGRVYKRFFFNNNFLHCFKTRMQHHK